MKALSFIDNNLDIKQENKNKKEEIIILLIPMFLSPHFQDKKHNR